MSAARRGAVLVTGGLLALTLTGCGGSSGDPATTAAAPTAPNSSAPASTGASGTGSDRASARASASASPTPANPAPAAEPDQSSVLDALPGSAGRGCVPTGDRAAVRSGGLAVTQLDLARQQWTPSSRTVRLVFVPQHAADASRLSVTGSGPGTFSATAERASDTEGNRYFLLTATVPASGTWTVRATTGTDRGCWTVPIS